MRKDLNAFDSSGVLRNWFKDPAAFKVAMGIDADFREGDFVFDTNGQLVNVRRFDKLPFGLALTGTHMTYRLNFNDKTLLDSPRFVGIGSSTLANTGLSAPLGYGNRVEARLVANATTPYYANLALGGQSSLALRPLANGGTAGRSIDDALTLNPTFVLIDEPTNWAAAYSETQQRDYWLEIFNYAYERGVIVVFNGPRPRTGFNTFNQQRLAAFSQICKTHPVLKFIVNDNFELFRKDGSIGELKTEFDNGDGIHLNSAGAEALENSSWAFWQNFFRSASPYNQFVIERSTNGGASYSAFDTITDLSITSKQFSRSTGMYRVKGRLRNSEFGEVSNSFNVTESSSPPTVNAGIDQSIKLHASSISVTGTATAASGKFISSTLWSQVSGPTTASFASAGSLNTTIRNLSIGDYVFKLTATDNDSTTAEDTIAVSVSLNAGERRLLFDLGGDGSPNGSKTPASLNGTSGLVGVDASGKTWNNLAALSGNGVWIASAYDTDGDVFADFSLSGDKRMGGTFGSGQSTNFAGATGDVADYPVSAGQDNMFVHSTTGLFKLTFNNPLGYKIRSVRFWGNRTDNTDTNRTLQMRLAGDTEWKQYNAANNINVADSVVFENLEGSSNVIEMQVLSGRTFGHISVIDLIYTVDDTPIPPSANAGSDKVIVLPENSAVLNGSGTAYGAATITGYAWTQLSGPNTASLSGQTTANLTASSLIEGSYVFRLTVTDSNSTTAHDDVSVVVSGALSSFRVLLDAGYGPNSLSNTGTPVDYSTTSPDVNGKYWNNFEGYGGQGVGSGFSDGCETGFLVDTDNAATSLNLQVVRNIYGTFSQANGSRGLNPDGENAAVGGYPASAVRDSAFAHSSKTNGMWRLTGLNPALIYTIKFWGCRNEVSVTSRIIEIKLSTDSVWKEYNGSKNQTFTQGATFEVTGVSSVDFDIRVKTGSTFGYIGVVDIIANVG